MTLTLVQASEQPLAGGGGLLSEGATARQAKSQAETEAGGAAQQRQQSLAGHVTDERPEIDLLEAEGQAQGSSASREARKGEQEEEVAGRGGGLREEKQSALQPASQGGARGFPEAAPVWEGEKGTRAGGEPPEVEQSALGREKRSESEGPLGGFSEAAPVWKVTKRIREGGEPPEEKQFARKCEDRPDSEGRSGGFSEAPQVWEGEAKVEWTSEDGGARTQNHFEWPRELARSSWSASIDPGATSSDETSPGAPGSKLEPRERFDVGLNGGFERELEQALDEALGPGSKNAEQTSLDWNVVREALGIHSETWLMAEARAAEACVSLAAELVASGVVAEETLAYALARQLGVGLLRSIQAEGLILTGAQSCEALARSQGLPIVSAINRRGQCVLLVAPTQVNLDDMAAYLERFPSMRSKLFLVPTPVLRAAIRKCGRGETLRKALNGLIEAFPQFSARTVLTGRQGVVLGLILTGGIGCLLQWTWTTLLLVHVACSLCFFCCVMFRLMAIMGLRKRGEAEAFEVENAQDMPVYTVLVALYKEAAVVPELLTSLSRLVWPRSKIEIKLVCESDDHETLAAIRAMELRSYVEVIEVPVSLPRTKPKALSYALPLSTGEFVVIYDAEDRPHPYQLLEAWHRFRRSDQNLACLQAPLLITNGREGWLAKMFAFEYSALFSIILPWLAQLRLVLPLGGTSNHFRRAALEEAGGWDPYNVTEDADLGIRLYRLGYDIGTINSPTQEDAPTEFGVWLPQRTRWFKGWIQTWLVHMRHPSALWRELGPASFMVTQILIPCTLAAVLSNVLLLAALLYAGVWGLITGGIPHYYGALLLFDIANIVLGYGGFLALGWLSLPRIERRSLWRYALVTPAYWIMLSLAGWRAVWQIYRRPHHWEKTPHLPRNRRSLEQPVASAATLKAQRRKAGPVPTRFASCVPTASMSRPA